MASHTVRPHVSRHAPGVLARTVRDGSPRGGPRAGRPRACETADFRGRCARPPSRSAQPLQPGCWSPPGRLERRRQRSRGCRGRSGSASEPFGSTASQICSRPTIALQPLDHHGIKNVGGAEAQAPRAVVADVAAEPHADIVRRAGLPARKGGALRRRRRQGRRRRGGRSAPCEALLAWLFGGGSLHPACRRRCISARGAALGLRPAKKQIEADAQTPANGRSQKVAFASTSVLLWQAKSSGIQAYILACTTHADSFTAAA